MSICDLEFDLSRSSNFRGHITILKFKYDFLPMSNTNYVAKVNDFKVIKQLKSVTLSLTFEGHPTSKAKSSVESS